MAEQGTLPVRYPFAYQGQITITSLQLRLYMFAASSGYHDSLPEKFTNYGPDERLTLRAVKLYADG
jgi:hypothetical protein